MTPAAVWVRVVVKSAPVAMISVGTATSTGVTTALDVYPAGPATPNV